MKPERMLVEKEAIKNIMFVLVNPYSSSTDARDACEDLVGNLPTPTHKQLGNEMRKDVREHPENYDEPEEVLQWLSEYE